MPQSVGSFAGYCSHQKTTYSFWPQDLHTEICHWRCIYLMTSLSHVMCRHTRMHNVYCCAFKCVCMSETTSSKWIRHCTFELCIKKWNKIPQSSMFCPAVHCHGSQSLRFIWCSYNKLDFLGLVCTHIALNNRGPPCTQGWGVYLSRSAEKWGPSGQGRSWSLSKVHHPVWWDRADTGEM